MKERNNNMKKAFVFDFDDTLAFTSARVIVKHRGWQTKRLTPAQFNSYKLQEEEEFYFHEFCDPRLILEGEPTNLLGFACDVFQEGHPVFILTARSDSVANAVQQFLRQFGITATAVHCVGKDAETDIPKAKRQVLLSIIENHDIVYFYDDDEANVEAAKEIGVKSYKV
tara:strand:- start:565 stop:1071 length:507 start_codon:yes stop_codon:yes gene_type:complete